MNKRTRVRYHIRSTKQDGYNVFYNGMLCIGLIFQAFFLSQAEFPTESEFTAYVEWSDRVTTNSWVGLRRENSDQPYTWVESGVEMDYGETAFPSDPTPLGGVSLAHGSLSMVRGYNAMDLIFFYVFSLLLSVQHLFFLFVSSIMVNFFVF